MKITVQNFRGISNAVIETAKITILAGRNGSGKSSIIQAAGAALSGQVIPFEGMKKNQALELVRRGSAESMVEIDSPLGSIRTTYPNAERKIQGAPNEISAHAAGIASILTENDKQRAETVARLLKTSPTVDDLAAALKTAGIPETYVEKIWSLVQSSGWDAAHKKAAEKGAQLKGGWENETGENYGSAKARDWFPPAWSADLNLATEPALAAELKMSQDALESTIAANAVQTVLADETKTLAASLPTLKAELADLDAAVGPLQKNESDLIAAKNRFVIPGQEKVVPCPHCRKGVVIEGDVLVLPKQTVSPEKIAELRKAFDETIAALDRIRQEIRANRNQAGQVQANITRAADAANKIISTVGRPAGDADKIAQARAQVETARIRLESFQKKNRAASIYSQLEHNKKIVEILAADGIRLEKLRNAIQTFNARLMTLSITAAWRQVELNSDLSVAAGGIRYAMLSESERFRAFVILQIAFAELDGSSVVLIDRADVLDGPGRNGLIKLAVARGREIVLGMTFSAPADVPNLDKIGAARYWIENGQAAKL
jgi:energy-coupling factor transporter ATP-binding protein EcfA2